MIMDDLGDLHDQGIDPLRWNFGVPTLRQAAKHTSTDTLAPELLVTWRIWAESLGKPGFPVQKP